MTPSLRAVLLAAAAILPAGSAAHCAPAVAAAPASAAAAPGAIEGKQVFERWCAQCHAEGPRHPGTASLQVKYGGTPPAALERRRDLSPELVAYFVRHGVSTMAPFRKTEITDAELAALGAYLGRRPTGSNRKPR